MVAHCLRARPCLHELGQASFGRNFIVTTVYLAKDYTLSWNVESLSNFVSFPAVSSKIAKPAIKLIYRTAKLHIEAQPRVHGHTVSNFYVCCSECLSYTGTYARLMWMVSYHTSHPWPKGTPKCHSQEPPGHSSHALRHRHHSYSRLFNKFQKLQRERCCSQRDLPVSPNPKMYTTATLVELASGGSSARSSSAT